ncbi:hypothetical protein MRB53_030671 [Persea americana]|uniref:Uncharacterized protein n=1 Tax=Persea americana TaxID=3435 RepID=A0ACC2KMX8_PERAE|nr:hypothetical protein MRB53_030671 [Persea americana]
MAHQRSRQISPSSSSSYSGSCDHNRNKEKKNWRQLLQRSSSSFPAMHKKSGDEKGKSGDGSSPDLQKSSEEAAVWWNFWMMQVINDELEEDEDEERLVSLDLWWATTGEE